MLKPTVMRTALDGRYQLAEIVGRGGMGVVYAANDMSDGRRVAVKVLDPKTADARAVERMHNEATVGRTVSHPAVVSVLDSGSADGVPYIVMEYVTGVSLHGLVANQGALPLRRALRIVAQLLAGLDAIHSCGFVHADMKSDNVLVSHVDDFDRVKIIDLGLAHPATEPSDGRILSGTPEYMAPEVIRGLGATMASDIYSVGVILYELITGTPPFCDDTAEAIMRSQVYDDVVPPSMRTPDRSIPPALDQAVMRALQKRPEDRFPSAAELARTLTQIHMTEEQAISTTRLPVFSTTAPTMQWTQRGIEIRPLPPADSPAIIEARKRLARELGRGERDAITVAVLELVQVLLAEHRMYAAAKELEATIDILAAGREVEHEPGPLWRLLLSLAAIYDGLGNVERALSTANVALLQAGSARSELGRRRARALVERLSHREQRRSHAAS